MMLDVDPISDGWILKTDHKGNNAATIISESSDSEHKHYEIKSFYASVVK